MLDDSQIRISMENEIGKETETSIHLIKEMGRSKKANLTSSESRTEEKKKYMQYPYSSTPRSVQTTTSTTSHFRSVVTSRPPSNCTTIQKRVLCNFFKDHPRSGYAFLINHGNLTMRLYEVIVSMIKFLRTVHRHEAHPDHAKRDSCFQKLSAYKN